MVVSPYIETIAKEFWSQTKQKWHPPYDIGGAISLLLPIDMVVLSDLSLSKIERWLAQKNITIPIEVNDRYLHGFVLIFRGSGFMFINGTDGEEERRYTMAHEASHFLLDYKISRDKAIQKLGNSIRDILDGFRKPTHQEQIDGLINGVSIKPFTHLVEKDGDGSFNNVKIFNSENNADALAMELLAPSSEIIKEALARENKVTFTSFDKRCLNILMDKYKLPGLIAEQYARQLAYSVTGGPSILTKLGF